MLRNWLEPQVNTIPQDFIDSIGGSPIVSQVLYERGILDVDRAREFLFPDYYHPASGLEMPDLGKAADILIQSISARKRIGVWGDFDVDGQTATTLLVSALRELGGNIIYHIPVRAFESHGIGIQALQKFITQGIDLLVTCDTGVSSHEAIDYAQTRGVSVIVTDHHDLPDELPTCTALVNPKRLPGEHPLHSLPGVGVAYKLVEQLYNLAGEQEKANQYLDLVALGIVADIALLRGDTRYLLQLGLQALRSTSRLGLKAMMDMSELDQSNLSEEHIAYVLAPRMNAVGRLDDANKIVELLTTQDISKARIIALDLEGMNAQRKLLSDQVYQAAQAQLTSDPRLLDFPILVLSHPSWPAGVIGIVASRLVEQYNRPVILFSAPPGKDARGSARSIENINITAAIAANQNLVKQFGGHPMAAGLALDPDCIPSLRLALSLTVNKMGASIQKEKDLQINGYLSLPELSLSLVEDMERLAPFGAGNPPLVLATRNLRLTGYSAVGRNADHLQLTIEDELGYSQRSIWWQGAVYSLPEAPFDLAYSVRASTYRGQRDVQVEWVDYRIVESTSFELQSKPGIEVFDLRREPNPLDKLHQIMEEEPLLVWGESDAKTAISCSDRYTLPPSNSLAIWTTPPGQEVLRTVLQTVKPSQIYLFAIDPGMDEPGAFIKRLLGLLKYRIKTSDGHTSLKSLAAATAQKVSTVRLGLEWLQANGLITINYSNDDEFQVHPGAGEILKSMDAVSASLNSALAESAAFRRHFYRVDKDQLFRIE